MNCSLLKSKIKSQPKNDEQKIQDKLDSIYNSYDKLNKLEQAKILEEITAAIASYVRYENNDNDATDRTFEALSDIAKSVQENFEKLVGISNDKKTFIRAMTKIFTLLLNTNVNTIEKIKKNT